jgi:dienelactone hydrolase
MGKMKIRLSGKRLLIGCLLLSILTGCATAAPETPSPEPSANLATEATTDIVYAEVDEKPTSPLDVYAPSQSRSWPVVVVVHGIGMNRRDLRSFAKTIASQGAVVYNIDVMHSSDDQTPSYERTACAVRFARSTAANYGGDPNRITMFGYSLGGASGMVIALAGEDFAGDCTVTDESALVDAFVAYEGSFNWPHRGPYSYIGGNPNLQVRLVHGDFEDTFADMPVEISMEFHQALEDAGYDTDVIVVEGASHWDANLKGTDAYAVTVQLVMELAHSSTP